MNFEIAKAILKLNKFINIAYAVQYILQSTMTDQKLSKRSTENGVKHW